MTGAARLDLAMFDAADIGEVGSFMRSSPAGTSSGRTPTGSASGRSELTPARPSFGTSVRYFVREGCRGRGVWWVPIDLRRGVELGSDPKRTTVVVPTPKPDLGRPSHPGI